MKILWHAIPILIKPDALTGEKKYCKGSFAASYIDFIICEFENLGTKGYKNLINENLSKKIRKYVKNMLSANHIEYFRIELTKEDREKLNNLKLKWNNKDKVSAEEIIVSSCKALGFHIVSSKNRIASPSDCELFYYDYLGNPFFKKLENYILSGQSIILLLCGKRDVWVLQIIKVYIRFYFLWQDSRKTYKNWLHVTDHDAPNYPQLIEMFFEN